MNTAPRMEALSQALADALDGAQVHAAVFTTFRFDPSFFERSVLPVLFDRGFSPSEGVRLAQLDDLLRDTGPIAVYYDPSALDSASGPARLDVQRIPCVVPRAVFHPKVTLVLCGPKNASTPDRLIVLTASANLTRAGWWTNVETAHLHSVSADGKDPMRDDLLRLVARLRSFDPTGRVQPAVDSIEAFLETRVRRAYGLPRLYISEQPLSSFLSARFAKTPRFPCLEVISPYVEDTAKAAVTKSLGRKYADQLRIYLPLDADGRATCSPEWHDTVSALPNTRLGVLPGGVTRYSDRQQDAASRFVHAKVYRFFDPARRRELMLVGSPNLTRAAHAGLRGGGNMEAAVLVEVKAGKSRTSPRPDWWMEAAPASHPEFATTPPEDEAPPPWSLAPLHLRYDWEHDSLEGCWSSDPGQHAESHLSIATVRLPIPPRTATEWQPIPADGAGLHDLLQQTSYADLEAADGATHRLLIDQLGTHARPSLLGSLKPHEILEYWSLLTPEQRDAFIDKHTFGTDILDGSGADGTLRPTRASDDTSIFDGFAGVFHAFSCLTERIDESLTRGGLHARQAEHLLLGRKHDSLPSLVDKLLAEPTAIDQQAARADDPVLAYVSLLCARDTVVHVRATHLEFSSTHAEALDRLETRLRATDAVRDRIQLENPAEANKFYGWLESHFVSQPTRGAA